MWFGNSALSMGGEGASICGLGGSAAGGAFDVKGGQLTLEGVVDAGSQALGAPGGNGGKGGPSSIGGMVGDPRKPYPGGASGPGGLNFTFREWISRERRVVDNDGLGLATQQADLQPIPELGWVRARLIIPQPVEPALREIAMP